MSYEVIPCVPNTPEWLAIRREGIGGSDAAAALGISKWRTPYQLWLDKTGQEIVPFEMDWWTAQTGHALEPKIREWYEREYATKVEQHPGICKSLKYPFMRFSSDGHRERDGIKRGFEAKKYLSKEGWGEPGTDEVPQDYSIQVQHGMIVLDVPIFDIAVSFWGSAPVVYHVKADPKMQEMIIDGEQKFWDQVQNMEEPIMMNAEDVMMKYSSSMAVPIEATDDIYKAYIDAKRYRESSEEWAARADQEKTIIKAFMGDCDTLTYEGKILNTWKSSAPGKKFDMDTFKQIYPDIYRKYQVDTAPRRTLLFK